MVSYYTPRCTAVLPLSTATSIVYATLLAALISGAYYVIRTLYYYPAAPLTLNYLMKVYLFKPTSNLDINSNIIFNNLSNDKIMILLKNKKYIVITNLFIHYLKRPILYTKNL